MKENKRPEYIKEILKSVINFEKCINNKRKER